MKFLALMAGVPIIFSLDLILPGTPACAPIPTLSPTLIWPARPTCPPNIHHSPTLVEPAIPTCEAITVWLPTSTLWAIWIRLSSFTPLCITVAPIVARSTHVLAPISTSSSMIAMPIWGIFSYPSDEGAKPKPSAPITQPACNIQLLPIRQSWYTVACGYNVQLLPTFAWLPTVACGWSEVLSPISAPSATQANGAIYTSFPILAVGAIYASGSMPVFLGLLIS